MAKLYPDSNVIGTDLSLIQPEGPPNCSFVKEDAELDEWTLPVVFDYIHLRMVHTCFDDYKALFKRCYDNLEPGGWIELQDAVFKLMCTDGTADGSYIERFSQLILQAGESIGRDLDISSKYKEMLIDAGFLDVEEEIGPVPGKMVCYPAALVTSIFPLSLFFFETSGERRVRPLTPLRKSMARRTQIQVTRILADDQFSQSSPWVRLEIISETRHGAR